MKLSIVIVSYNVRAFVEQCLDSVQKASEGIATEVFVVDNASADDTVEAVGSRYPWVHLIANSENLGFASANNIEFNLFIFITFSIDQQFYQTISTMEDMILIPSESCLPLFLALRVLSFPWHKISLL